MDRLTNLKGVGVLITRPKCQGERLAELIRSEGGDVVEFPVIEIAECLDKQVILSALQTIPLPAIWIFVSPNAVLHAISYIHQVWPTLPNDIEFVAIGEGTVKALHEHGFSIVHCPNEQFNSEGVLALPLLQNIAGKQIIIIKGEGGRELLASSLRGRGAKVTEVCVYKRILPVLDVDNILPSEIIRNINVVIITSAESLKNLLHLIGQKHRMWLLSKYLIVSSDRIAQLASEQGFVSLPLIADNASDQALILALKKWKGELNGTDTTQANQ
jgi:uroporphyrinogen-III synthase